MQHAPAPAAAPGGRARNRPPATPQHYLLTEPGGAADGPAPLAARSFRSGTGRAALRIALYSHDTLGLGHIRRNLLLAQTLAAPPLDASVLLVAGTAGGFTLPPGVDWLTLPGLHKDAAGQYHPRTLAISLPDLIALRAQTIQAALTAFAPHLLIVDKVPWGVQGELAPTLAALHARGGTRCVLGLRDVLDEPAAVRRDWAMHDNEEAVRRYYDAIWVYGDPAVYDLARAYRLAGDVAAKIRYTGYLDASARPAGDATPPDGLDPWPALMLPPGRLALCLLGGGQDGAALAEAFAQAPLPPDTNGLILAGPCMPAEARRRLHQRVRARPRLRLLDFCAEPTRLLARADRVIAMGGYNTICEILSFRSGR
jgi:predicted glycosyltransferase